ncbi:tripartite tricarboxylate transporter permease [Candidatus Dependentiae bacterium]|nr:tripartite tricarboxylate transporter permease [Candidatus Dependentiae bacterium]
MEGIIVIAFSLLGTLAGGILCMIPSLHIYNVAGIAIILWIELSTKIPYYTIGPFFMALMVSFAFINTIPMTFFSAADESAGASILPTTDMLKSGKGRDASVISGLATFVGAVILVLLTPFVFYIAPYIYLPMRAHLHWIIGLILVFYVMSEWPKGAGRGKTPWAKFKNAWHNCFAGLLTFVLSSIIGLIITSKPLAPPEKSFQNIMPIFLGFFAFPSIIQAMMSEAKYPVKQYNSKYLNCKWSDFGYGALPGIIGGLITAFIPAVTVGISAIFAGHITNHRNLRQASFEKPKNPNTAVHIHIPEIYYQQERVFLVAGGINKIIYYVGAFLFLFAITDLTPNGMGRGGMNILLKPIFSPERGDFAVMLATIFFTSALSLLLLIYFTDWTIKIMPKINVRLVYGIVTVVLLVLLFVMGGGWMAIGVAAATTCVGLIPVFYSCRRSHCMAVLLVPIALNMAGYGDAIARFLGLM